MRDVHDFILDIGSQGGVPSQLKNKNTFVNGCQSQVWIVPMPKDGTVKYTGDSDSFMVRGIINLVCDIVNHATKEELDQLSYNDLEPIAKYFSASRRRGLQAIINRIRLIHTEVNK
jgi:cysteine desulfuration protein SufE